MPIQVLMPALSPTMEKGNLAKWLKKEGEKVKSGDIIAEIETDKATMEVEAIDEGTLGKILVPEGTTDVAVNTPIAVILGEGELELIEAHLQSGSPAIGRAPKDLAIPEGCSLFAVIRDGIATPLRPDTLMLEGDKVIAIGKQECQALLHDQLIGDPEAIGADAG